MPWFKVDDGFWSHPKVLDLPATAVALWVRAGSYAAQHLTDGAVKPSTLRMLGHSIDDANALVEVGLWDSKSDGKTDGYAFHDWDKYQPASASTKEKRDEVSRARAEAGRKGAEKRWSQTDGKADGKLPSRLPSEADGKPMAPSRPDPTSSSYEEERPRKRGSRLSEDWVPTRESVDKMRAECPGIDVQAEHPAFVDYWIAQPGQKGVKTNWDSTWRNWMRRKRDDHTSRGRTATPARLTPEERARQTLALAFPDDDHKEITA